MKISISLPRRARDIDLVGVVAIVVSSFLSFAGGCFVAIKYDSPHAIARSGAIIEALTALIVFLQYNRDEKIKKHSFTMDKIISSLKSSTVQPAGQSSEVIAQEIRLYFDSVADTQRQRLLLIFVVGTVTGVLLHGFGDLLAPFLGIHFEQSKVE